MALTLTPEDLVAIWTHDLRDGAGTDMAYQVLNRAARSADLASTQTESNALATALVTALANHPEVVDALATAILSKVGMIPTSREIANSVGALTWHGTNSE